MESDEVTRAPQLSSGAKKIMISTNPKTRKMYAETFESYEIFCKVSKLPITEQKTLCNYLHDIIKQRKVEVGSIWKVYSAINNHMRMVHSINCNEWKNLRIIMKNITKHYISKKSVIISAEQVREFLTKKIDPENDSFDFLTVVAFLFMYFGLLRMREVLEVSIDMVKLDRFRKLVLV